MTNCLQQTAQALLGSVASLPQSHIQRPAQVHQPACQELVLRNKLCHCAAPGAWAAQQLDKDLLAAEVRPAVTEAIRLQADVETRVLLGNLKVCSGFTAWQMWRTATKVQQLGRCGSCCVAVVQEMADAEKAATKGKGKGTEKGKGGAKPKNAAGAKKKAEGGKAGKENTKAKAPVDLTVRKQLPCSF